MDTLRILIHDGQYKEIDPTDFMLKDNPTQAGEAEKEEKPKEEEEVEEEEEEEKEKSKKKKSKGYQISEEANEWC